MATSTSPIDESRPWRTFAELAEAGDSEALSRVLEELPAGEVGRAMAHLDDEERERVLALLGAEEGAELLHVLSLAQAAEVCEQLPAEQAAALLAELPSNAQADLLNELTEDQAEAILAEVEPRVAADLRQLASYSGDVAGGVMVTEYLAYPSDAQVQDVVADMREHADAYADYAVQYAYTTDAEGRLAGVLRLRDLVLARPQTKASELVVRDPHSVRTDTPLDELARFFREHAFLGAPVVDAKGRLVGLVRRGDVQRAVGRRDNRDHLKSVGIVGGEELRTMPVLSRSGRRLSWLSINVVLNVIAASVIAFFEDTLSAVIALAVFLPIISDMSGCSGNQAIAVSMRELSLGLVRPQDALHVWLKEVSVGVLNGLALGLLLAGVAWAWKGNPWLGLVVGSALLVNTIVAVSLGGVVPLLLRRLKMDPALASGPLLTTVTDLCGFLFVLGFATIMLARLT